MTKVSKGNLLLDLLAGAIAGALASKAMGQVTSFMYKHEDKQARRIEDEARGGKQAFGVAAEKVAGLLDVELDDEQRKKFGARIHWATAIGAGALYGVMRGRVPGVTLGAGLAFGTAFWLIVDEGMNPVFGFTPGPSAFPWQTHARGLGGHLTYGVATELQLRALDHLM